MTKPIPSRKTKTKAQTILTSPVAPSMNNPLSSLRFSNDPISRLPLTATRSHLTLSASSTMTLSAVTAPAVTKTATSARIDMEKWFFLLKEKSHITSIRKKAIFTTSGFQSRSTRKKKQEKKGKNKIVFHFWPEKVFFCLVNGKKTKKRFWFLAFLSFCLFFYQKPFWCQKWTKNKIILFWLENKSFSLWLVNRRWQKHTNSQSYTNP